MIMKNRLRILMAEKKDRDGVQSASYRTISEATGISTSTLYNWTSNKIRSYDGGHVGKLCGYFDCELGDLLYLSDED